MPFIYPIKFLDKPSLPLFITQSCQFSQDIISLSMPLPRQNNDPFDDVISNVFVIGVNSFFFLFKSYPLLAFTRSTTVWHSIESSIMNPQLLSLKNLNCRHIGTITFTPFPFSIVQLFNFIYCDHSLSDTKVSF